VSVELSSKQVAVTVWGPEALICKPVNVYVGPVGDSVGSPPTNVPLSRESPMLAHMVVTNWTLRLNEVLGCAAVTEAVNKIAVTVRDAEVA
jgi:hypothetical protein